MVEILIIFGVCFLLLIFAGLGSDPNDDDDPDGDCGGGY